MLPARALPGALAALRGRPYHGVLCRAVLAGTLYGFQHPDGYTPRPLYSLGAPSAGARFTPKGGAPAIYLAEDHQTTLREVLQVGRSARLTPQMGTGAVVLYTVEVSLRSVLGLTELSVQRALGTNRIELAGPWRFRKSKKKAPTHLLGAAVVRNASFDGLRFESTKGPGACLVVFADLVKSPGYVRVHDPQSRLIGALP